MALYRVRSKVDPDFFELVEAINAHRAKEKAGLRNGYKPHEIEGLKLVTSNRGLGRSILAGWR